MLNSQLEPRTLPEPSPELVLLAVLTTAFVKTLPRTKRENFMGAVSDALELVEQRSRVVRIRPQRFDAEARQAREQAVQWWRTVAPAILSEGERG